MSAKITVPAVLLVFLLLLTVFMVELTVPLSVYSDFNELCRIALIRMEVNGGMTADIENDLFERLRELNLTDIRIEGTEHAKYGDYIRLQVSAATRNRIMTSLFRREIRYRYFSYDKTSVSRRIVK
jgi:hypothetical protein